MVADDRFSAPGVTCRERDGFTYIDVTNRHATARLCSHGAHVLHFAPLGQKPVLWLSRLAIFHPDKAIRGGIPVCWPWFGSHPTDSSLPSHGFARTSEWELVTISGTDDITDIAFELVDSPASRELWDWRFKLRLEVSVGSTLSVSLTTENRDQKPMELTQALHSYFTVGDITSISVAGLEGRAYLDQVGEMRRKVQNGIITFQGEVDRDYLDTPDPCTIVDPQIGREIKIEKRGSSSTVVWNPWIEKASRMADFGDDEYRTMVCVETTNATEFDTLRINPGERHTISTRISTSEISRVSL